MSSLTISSTEPRPRGGGLEADLRRARRAVEENDQACSAMAPVPRPLTLEILGHAHGRTGWRENPGGFRPARRAPQRRHRGARAGFRTRPGPLGRLELLEPSRARVPARSSFLDRLRYADRPRSGRMIRARRAKDAGGLMRYSLPSRRPAECRTRTSRQNDQQKGRPWRAQANPASRPARCRAAARRQATTPPITALNLPAAQLSPEMAAYFAKCEEKLGFVPNVLKAYAFDPAKLAASSPCTTI